MNQEPSIRGARDRTKYKFITWTHHVQLIIDQQHNTETVDIPSEGFQLIKYSDIFGERFPPNTDRSGNKLWIMPISETFLL